MKAIKIFCIEAFPILLNHRTTKRFQSRLFVRKQLRNPKPMKIDELTVSIINNLRDGRVRFKEIAQKLSIAEGTVRSRVRNLLNEEVLEITGLVDPEKIPGQSVVYIGVKLKTIELVEKGAEIAKVRGVTAVGVVTGRFDLILTVTLRQGFGLLEFYTEELSKVKEIGSVEAFVVYKSYNIKIPCQECSI